jgi:hypothetical protein
VHVLVLLAAGFALCFGGSINFIWQLLMRGLKEGIEGLLIYVIKTSWVIDGPN